MPHPWRAASPTPPCPSKNPMARRSKGQLSHQLVGKKPPDTAKGWVTITPGRPWKQRQAIPSKPRGGLLSCRLMILMSKGLILRSMSILQKEKHPTGCFLFKIYLLGSSKSPRASSPSSSFGLQTSPQILLPFITFLQETGQSILEGLPASSCTG